MNSKLKTTIGRVTASLAALAMVAGATAASAQSYRHGGGYYGGRGYSHHGNDAGVAIAGGIVGLALGAAIAGNGNHGQRYNSGYGYGEGYGYAPPPPPPRYYDGYGYARPYRGSDCWTTREYDRYRGEMYERTVCR